MNFQKLESLKKFQILSSNQLKSHQGGGGSVTKDTSKSTDRSVHTDSSKRFDSSQHTDSSRVKDKQR